MDQQTTPSELDEFLGIEEPTGLRRHWKKAAIALALLLVLLIGWLFFGPQTGTKSYATGEVTRGDLEVQVTAIGNLAPTNRVQVGSELSGLISKVYVDVNDHVTEGQPLALIDTRNLLIQIARSQAGVASAQASVGQAQATLRQSTASLSRLREVYRLSGGKVPSKTELENAEAEQGRALANLRAAQAQVASAEAQLNADNTNFGKATIRSPVSGVVLARQIEPGQTVAASFNTPTLFDIAEDLSEMKLEVKVDEADVGQIQAGQPATFTVDAFPGVRFPASIIRVNVGSNTSSTTSSSTSASSATVVSYNAVLRLRNADLKLRPGMTATASIVTSQEHNALLVPNSALRYRPAAKGGQTQGGGGFSMRPPMQQQRPEKEARIARGSTQTIYMLDAGSTKPRPVQVTAGSSDGSRTIITGKGIRPGDKVITGELAKPE